MDMLCCGKQLTDWNITENVHGNELLGKIKKVYAHTMCKHCKAFISIQKIIPVKVK